MPANRLDRAASPFLHAAPVQTTPYDPGRTREWIRGLLALVSLAVFLLVISFYLWASFHLPPAGWSQFKEAAAAILPAVTSVLGTVLGFYFGSQKQ